MKFQLLITLKTIVFELTQQDRPETADSEIAEKVAHIPALTKKLTDTVNVLMFTAADDRMLRRIFGQIRRDCTKILNTLYDYVEAPEDMSELEKGAFEGLKAWCTYSGFVWKRG